VKQEGSSVLKKPGRLRLGWLLAAAAILTFAGANAHLIYVAFTSHPGCVQHLKEAGAKPGQFRAAASDC
jgi:hypothetical protein